MRQAIFRTLAGLIAIGWVLATVAKPPGWVDIHSTLGQAAIMGMFVVYAVIGNRFVSATAPVQFGRQEQLEEMDHEDSDPLQEPPDEG